MRWRDWQVDESPRGAGSSQSGLHARVRSGRASLPSLTMPGGHGVVRKAGPGRTAGSQLPALGLQARVRLTHRSCLAQGVRAGQLDLCWLLVGGS